MGKAELATNDLPPIRFRLDREELVVRFINGGVYFDLTDGNNPAIPFLTVEEAVCVAMPKHTKARKIRASAKILAAIYKHLVNDRKVEIHARNNI